MASGRKRHIPRTALPWREPKLTECAGTLAGRLLVSRADAISEVHGGWNAVEARGQADGLDWKAISKEKDAWLAGCGICLVCWDTTLRWGRPWNAHPEKILERECDSPNWPKPGDWRARHDRLRAELWAISSLIEAHRDEFDGLVEQQETWAVLEAMSGVRRR